MLMQVIYLTYILFLQVWVERFREWMSKQVLQQLLVAAEKAHKVYRSLPFCCADLAALLITGSITVYPQFIDNSH